MLQLSTVAELTTVVLSELDVCKETELPVLHAKLNAFDCISAGMIPHSKADVRHLLSVLDRLQEFLRGDPTDENEREVALSLSARIIASLRQ